MEVGMHNKVN